MVGQNYTTFSYIYEARQFIRFTMFLQIVYIRIIVTVSYKSAEPGSTSAPAGILRVGQRSPASPAHENISLRQASTIHAGLPKGEHLV